MTVTKTIVELTHPEIDQPFTLNEIPPDALQDLVKFLRPGTKVSTAFLIPEEKKDEEKKPVVTRKRVEKPVSSAPREVTGADVSAIIRVLASEPQLIGEIAEKSGVDKRQAAACLRQMVEAGMVVQSGKGRGTRYAAKESTQAA